VDDCPNIFPAGAAGAIYQLQHKIMNHLAYFDLILRMRMG
jgi:hypothetical protein